MKRVLIFILLFVSAPFLAAETIYKAVDEHGRLVFSDRPSDNAEEVDIGKPQIIHRRSFSRNITEESESVLPEKKPSDEKYTLIAISSPAHDAAVRSNAGELGVSVQVKPALKSGDKISISMDGRTVASGTGTQYTISNISRGTHTLKAQIVNTRGQVAISSSPVQFHMLRFYVQKKQGGG